MANKRRPLSFPELEPKGRRAILRTAEEVKAEDEILESQQSGTSGSEHAGIPENQHAGNRLSYPKATYRLSPEAIDAMEEMKRILRRRYRAKATLEQIAEEAILNAHQDLLRNQDNSFLVNKFASAPDSQNAGIPASQHSSKP